MPTCINLNESHLVDVGKKTFLSFNRPPSTIEENLKPHITISRSEKATLIINDVTREDEGVYRFLLALLTLSSFQTSRNTTLEVRGKIYGKKQNINKSLLSLALCNRSVEIQQFTTQIGEKALLFKWPLSEEVSVVINYLLGPLVFFLTVMCILKTYSRTCIKQHRIKWSPCIKWSEFVSPYHCNMHLY